MDEIGAVSSVRHDTQMATKLSNEHLYTVTILELATAESTRTRLFHDRTHERSRLGNMRLGNRRLGNRRLGNRRLGNRRLGNRRLGNTNAINSFLVVVLLPLPLPLYNTNNHLLLLLLLPSGGLVSLVGLYRTA
jgi:hypothetical protein